MLVSNLTYAQLDYWVAKSLKLANPKIDDAGDTCTFAQYNETIRKTFAPTSGWIKIGSLITSFGISLIKNPDKNEWGATCKGVNQIGRTPQEAVCRCVVELHYGKEVA